MAAFLIFIGSLLVAFAIGVLIGAKIDKEKPKGTLQIINYDDDGPYLFLELNSNISIESLKHCENVIFDIKVEDARE